MIDHPVGVLIGTVIGTAIGILIFVIGWYCLSWRPQRKIMGVQIQGMFDASLREDLEHYRKFNREFKLPLEGKGKK